MALVLDGSAGISGVDGTASNPAIEGTDSNTGIFYPAADTVAIGTGGTERLRVDSAGNAGLGVTPSAWTSTIKALEITGGAALGGGFNSAYLLGNAFYNASVAPVYRASGSGAGQYAIEAGVHTWKIAPSGTAGNAITFTQAMTLDASGNLGVGTASPQVIGSLRVVDIRAAAGGGLRFGITSSDHGYLYSDSNVVLGTTSTTAAMTFQTNNGTERARITSGGRLNIGTTGGSASRLEVIGPETMCYFVNETATDATFRTTIGFTDNGGVIRGTIKVNNSATQYNTSSDYRLKENVQPMIGALDKVALLKPCTFNWKVDGHDGQGFIAHELAEVFPDAVAGEKDAIETYTDEEGNEHTRPAYQGIDTSFLVATLTAAIQEQQAMIEEMKAEIEALKGSA